MSHRIPLIAGNWKMFKTAAEASQTARDLLSLLNGRGTDGVEAMVAPPFTALESVRRVIDGSCLSLGAQNMFWETEGAYTGEISPAMLRAAGCRYVLIGHSERRLYFGETDQTINRKIGAALRHGLIPILCIGETEAEREDKKTFSVLDKQIGIGLEGFASSQLEEFVVAYEPVWAIGTGKTASREQAQEAHQFIRSRFEKKFGNALAKSIRIQYGGSVKPDNIRGLMEMPDVDGALVGGASLSAGTFSRIIRYIDE